MAALEYLTQNSLTSYPFKSRKVSGVGDYALKDDWFYDILFVSYSRSIRSVYISYIEKIWSVEGIYLKVHFNNAETLAPIGIATIHEQDIVDHRAHTTKSFASYTDNATFAVKMVLGPGLADKYIFNQSFSKQETELSNAAVILYTPTVNNIIFENYMGVLDADGEQQPSFATAITATSIANKLQFYHNFLFTLESSSVGGLSVSAGAGGGLYDDCPERDPNLYTLNKLAPNSGGALYLNPSTCYTAQVLTQELKDTLGTLLDPYYSFDAFDGHDYQTNLDVVYTNHSIVFQNFCRPKCTPETMGAFAYYLNRVSDGAHDLDLIAKTKTETRGYGSRESGTIFKVPLDGFCKNDADNPFTRCNDTSALHAITCGTAFKKYYHEGRTLEIYRGPSDIQSHTIVEVFDNYTVRVATDTPMAEGVDVPFRVTDNGVISNMNCAALSYNATSEAFLRPYFQVRSATNESFTSAGEYVTYLSVVVAVFNPSAVTSTVEVVFTSTDLTRQGSFKIRTAGEVYTTLTPIVTLGCREYAFVEAVYYIGCGKSGGELHIDVNDNTISPIVLLGSKDIGPLSGADCQTTTTGSVSTFLVLQSSGAGNEFRIPWGDNITSVEGLLGSTPPSWLSYQLDYLDESTGKHYVVLTVNSSIASANASAMYSLFFREKLPNGAVALSHIVLEYVATPIILSPRSSLYTESHPLLVSVSEIYSIDNPLLTVIASNMLQLGSKTVQSAYKYHLYAADGGAPPPTLTINESTGKITGQLAPTTDKGAFLKIIVTAENPSGTSASQLINLYVAADSPPTITLIGGTP